MKHIPNILTLSNLFFGCIAIAFILNAPAFFTTVNGEDFTPVVSLQQMYYGSIFIGLAALMDVLDGLAARLLKAESAIGRDLDSLADVVSFGVAPAMILFKLLWYAYMSEPGAMETSMWVTAPAFLLPCFGALRLARYNHTADEQKQYFMGLPIPAAGLVVASLPLIYWFPTNFYIGEVFQSRLFLYVLIGLLSLLMVSKIKFLKWKSPSKGIKAWFPQLLLALVFVIGFIFLKFAIVPLVFILYVFLSLLVKRKDLKYIN